MTSELRDPSVAITAVEAAQLLGVSPRTVKRMRSSELPYWRVGSRGDRRYSRADVERYKLARAAGTLGL
jgi:excisionase family DNA binding protein